MKPRTDRTVHARCDSMEIVRYDRSGKWYLEPTIDGLDREHVGVAEAAEYALWGVRFAYGEIYVGRPGGAVFDRKVLA